MKNILLALACLFTFGVAKAGNDKPKCCKESCTKQCVEQCKKNNCTDKDCCKLCGQKCSEATACKKDRARTNASTASVNVKNTNEKHASCCEKSHK
jgi:hypothetical protein